MEKFTRNVGPGCGGAQVPSFPARLFATHINLSFSGKTVPQATDHATAAWLLIHESGTFVV